MEVRQAEEVAGALARLHVLEGHVVDLLALVVGVADVAQHLLGARADVQLVGGAADRRHEAQRLVTGAGAGGEAGHRVGEDVGARVAEQVHRLGADEQRLRRVEAAGDADDDLLDTGELKALGEALHLDLEDLGAALVAGGRVGGHVGEALVAPQGQEAPGARQRQRHGDGAVALQPRALALNGVAEGRLAHALLDEPLQVDLGAEHGGLVGEALGLGEQHAVLGDERVAVPGEVGGGLAGAGGRVEVGGEAAGRLAHDELAAVVGLAHGDVRGRQVEQDRGAGEGGVGRGGHGHPQVLADLDEEGEAGLLVGLEQQARAERDAALAAQGDRVAHGGVAGGELAALVELAVVGQVGLRHDAEDAALGEDDGAVVEQGVDLEGEADDADERQPPRRVEDHCQRLQTGVEEGALVEEVLAGVGRQAQLGEEGERGALVGRLAQEGDGLLGVVDRIGHADRRQGDRHTHEVVVVEVEEAVHRGLVVHRDPAVRLAHGALPTRFAHWDDTAAAALC